MSFLYSKSKYYRRCYVGMAERNHLRRCYNCQSDGHMSIDCPEPARYLRCMNCRRCHVHRSDCDSRWFDLSRTVPFFAEKSQANAYLVGEFERQRKYVHARMATGRPSLPIAHNRDPRLRERSPVAGTWRESPSTSIDNGNSSERSTTNATPIQMPPVPNFDAILGSIDQFLRRRGTGDSNSTRSSGEVIEIVSTDDEIESERTKCEWTVRWQFEHTNVVAVSNDDLGSYLLGRDVPFVLGGGYTLTNRVTAVELGGNPENHIGLALEFNNAVVHVEISLHCVVIERNYQMRRDGQVSFSANPCVRSNVRQQWVVRHIGSELSKMTVVFGEARCDVYGRQNTVWVELVWAMNVARRRFSDVEERHPIYGLSLYFDIFVIIFFRLYFFFSFCFFVVIEIWINTGCEGANQWKRREDRASRPTKAIGDYRRGRRPARPHSSCTTRRCVISLNSKQLRTIIKRTSNQKFVFLLLLLFCVLMFGVCEHEANIG